VTRDKVVVQEFGVVGTRISNTLYVTPAQNYLSPKCCIVNLLFKLGFDQFQMKSGKSLHVHLLVSYSNLHNFLECSIHLLLGLII
jgi:hypothetical protein